MGNNIGKLFTVTSFGESHGKCVGVLVDGCPAGLPLTIEDIQVEVDKRRPDVMAGGTGRSEWDQVEVLSGLLNDYTTGAPICMLVWNRDTDPSAYEEMRYIPRPGHADYAAFAKYGGFNDFRGGGRFSGRITAGFVMAGAVARKLLSSIGIDIIAHTVQIGDVQAARYSTLEIMNRVWENPVRCADHDAAVKMTKTIEKIKAEGDSLGGIVEAIALHVPVGLGEPVFDTLEGDLSKAFFAIPAVKGVEFGAGFSSTLMKGSENNDKFIMEGNKMITATNNAGGISGGISNGMPVTARIAFKPTPSISRVQKTVEMRQMAEVELAIKGRHDTCVVPRAVPIVEAVMAMTVCDFAMRAGLIKEVLK
jgi:chorismate synthase